MLSAFDFNLRFMSFTSAALLFFGWNIVKVLAMKSNGTYFFALAVGLSSYFYK